MAAEKRQRVEEVFSAALDRDLAERAAFVARVCGDDKELRREVESLLGWAGGKSLVDRDRVEGLVQDLEEQQSTLSAGETVGRYQVLGKIGEGGMGEVYLARDASLGRQVALKLLPATSMLNQERLRRFEREALVASALNHPNIVTIYEVGQANSLHYIVTEYVEGETLRARMSGKGFKLREVLDISIQVASALAGAHQAGVVHRDVKPENIMIRSDGYVKVLDFGLAKLIEDLSGLTSARFEAPTKPAVKTNPGVVMGTAAYMSPEQARGLKVDARTDVWSLGVVIYEMVSGQRPFAGATHSDTIVSILERDPAPLSHQAPDTPSELERIVTKALAKDTEERYQTIKDLLIDLRRLSKRLEVEAELERSAQTVSGGASASVASSGPQSAPAETDVQAAARLSEPGQARTTSSIEYVVTEIQRHKRGAALLGVVLVLLFASVGYGIYRIFRQPSPLSAPFETTKLTPLTTTGRAKIAAISPDGKYVVYAQEDNRQQSLWVKQITTGSTVQIVPPADVRYWGLTFSNDSDYVYYVKNEKGSGPFNKLYRVAALGGVSKKLMEQVDSAVAFSPDGRRFAFVRDNLKKEETLIVLANADGSEERTLATRKAPARFASDFATRIAWSPDGKTIACAAGNGDDTNVVGVSVEAGSERPLSSRKWRHIGQVAWLSDGSGLVMIAADMTSTRTPVQVWHVSYPDGGARRITNDLNQYRDVTLTATSSAFVTVQTNEISNIWVAPQEDTSRARQITSGRLDTNLSWTPDGKIVYWSNANGTRDIWIMDADGRNQKQLTHEGDNGRPGVSRDGRYIVFASARAGRTNIWRMEMEGSNQKQLTDGKRNFNPHLSPDGRWIVYVSWDSGNGSLWKIPINGGEPIRLSEPTANLPVISPDGKQIACFYWDEQASPPRGVMILPFAGGAPTKRFNINAGDGFALRWAADGRALLYINSNSNIWSQPVIGGASMQVTNFQGDQIFDFDYSPDGKWLAVTRGRVTDDVVLIETQDKATN